MKTTQILPRLTPLQIWAFFGFMCTTLFLVTGIQLGSGQEPEAAFGGLAVFQIIMFEAIVALLLVPVFSRRAGQPRRKYQAIGSAILFFLFGLVSLFQVHDYLQLPEFQIDLLVAAIWFAGAVLLFLQVTARTRSVFAMGCLAVAFLLQIGLSGLDLFDEVLNVEATTASGETLETAVFGLVLVLFAMALLASLSMEPQTGEPAGGLGNRLSKLLFEAEYGRIGALAAIGYNNAQFALWKQVNRKKSFADFYAWQISRKLDKGRAHRTLGARQFERDSLFASAPVHDAQSLGQRRPDLLIDHFIALGLAPHHVVVDYGCGSLRIGRHLIDYLDGGKYWGLDVTDRFYSDGLALLDNEVKRYKAPQCRIITDNSLAEVRAVRPDFIFSVAVLKHVPESELDGYFDKLCAMMHAATTLVVTFSASPREERISGKSWSWSQHRIEKLIRTRLPGHKVAVTLEKSQKARKGVELTYAVMVARAN